MQRASHFPLKCDMGKANKCKKIYSIFQKNKPTVPYQKNIQNLLKDFVKASCYDIISDLNPLFELNNGT